MSDEKASSRSSQRSHARAHVLVSGRVQGVFFRDATRQKAQALGLSGWVANMDDGRVEAFFEGDSGAVEEAVRWCGEGPEQAAVEDVDTSYEEPRGESGGFEVR